MTPGHDPPASSIFILILALTLILTLSQTHSFVLALNHDLAPILALALTLALSSHNPVTNAKGTHSHR